MSDTEQFLELLAELLSENPNADIDITLETPLADGGLELTSLELIELLVQMEERLDTTIPDEAVMNAFLDDVNDLFRLVEGRDTAAVHQPAS